MGITTGIKFDTVLLVHAETDILRFLWTNIN